MFTMIEHIEYLVARHDCVTIPGWGAFIANYESARYNDRSGVYSRPQRVIGFNAQVKHNDGLLAQSLVRREGMTYDDAMRFIADSVKACKQQLLAGAEVSMGRLGYFSHGDGRHMEFVPFQASNSCDGYYGLSDLEISRIAVLERELEAAAATVPPAPNLFARKSMRIAASVAVLIGLGVVLTTPITTDKHDLAGMAPQVTAPQAQHLGVTVEQGVSATGITLVSDSYHGLAATGNEAGRYYMVIATLRNRQELDAFKRKYADLVPYMKMLDYKSMTCVYVARSDDYSALMALKDELPNALRDIWIYS